MGDGTSKKLVRDIASALTTQRQDDLRIKALRLSRSRGAIPATLGTGFEGATAAGSAAGGGIVGDMTEPNAKTRTFHAVPRQITSTDGVFEIEIRDLQSIDLEDQEGEQTKFVFAQPS